MRRGFQQKLDTCWGHHHYHIILYTWVCKPTIFFLFIQNSIVWVAGPGGAEGSEEIMKFKLLSGFCGGGRGLLGHGALSWCDYILGRSLESLYVGWFPNKVGECSHVGRNQGLSATPTEPVCIWIAFMTGGCSSGKWPCLSSLRYPQSCPSTPHYVHCWDHDASSLAPP